LFPTAAYSSHTRLVLRNPPYHFMHYIKTKFTLHQLYQPFSLLNLKAVLWMS